MASTSAQFSNLAVFWGELVEVTAVDEGAGAAGFEVLVVDEFGIAPLVATATAVDNKFLPAVTAIRLAEVEAGAGAGG